LIERKKKICIKCGRESYIFSKGRCETCAKQSYGSISRTKKPTGELALFQALWLSRPHMCEVTGVVIKEFNVQCFMHVLSKKAYPKFRLNHRNILLVAPEVHHEYDNGDRSKPMFCKVRELHDSLITEYYK
jgi:ribosomal protein L37E